jgi:peptide-methionine (S)-S-oxide reductase
MGGHLKDPEYEDVLTDRTGHAEVVRVLYDENVLSYEQLLIAFFSLHNPSVIPGVKYKYRTSIFYHSPFQKEIAEGLLKELKERSLYVYPVKTTIVNAEVFYRAEEYHQQYYVKNS